MRGLGIGYEYLPEPGRASVRLTDRHGVDRVVEAELLGYTDVRERGAGVFALVREDGRTWIEAVRVQRLQAVAHLFAKKVA
jgi:hypothetical protein